jgi:hypothetical protein
VGTYLDGDYPVKIAGTITPARAVEATTIFSVKGDPRTGEIEVTTIKK